MRLIKPVSLAVVLLSLMPRAAAPQTVMFGVKGSLTTIDPVSAAAPYVRNTWPLDVGPVIEAALPRAFALEASALRKRVSYGRTVRTVFPSPGVSSETRVSNTAAHSWEVPVVVKKYMDVGKQTRAYGNLGLNLRRTSGTTHFETFRLLVRTFPGPPGPPPAEFVTGNEDPSELSLNRDWSTGLVLGGGLQFKIRALRLQPELRYTRWANETFRSSDGNLRSTRNSLDFLVGFTFQVGN